MEPEAKTEPEAETKPARTKPEHATELAHAGAAEEERAPAPEVRIRWDVGATAERTKVQREHAAEVVRVRAETDEPLAALLAQARDEAAQLLEATVRQAQAA